MTARAYPIVRPSKPAALARLTALAKAATILSQETDAEVRELGNALAVWIAEGAGEPLDSAIGLRQRGGISPKRALQIDDRDAQLRNLAREHSEWVGLDAHVIAQLMREAFERYEANRWPRDRHSLSAPTSEPAATFWRLLRNGERVPQAKWLRRILAWEFHTPV